MEANLIPDESHTVNSSTREKVLEHLFVGDLLRCLWRGGARDIEVLRAEVDRGGYDLVLEANGILRHIQLKASHKTAKTHGVGINLALARKPSGCVVWMQFDPVNMELGPFLWFGGAPATPLPDLGDRIGKHSKAHSKGTKAERPNIRQLRRSQFETLSSMESVVSALFGCAPDKQNGSISQ